MLWIIYISFLCIILLLDRTRREKELTISLLPTQRHTWALATHVTQIPGSAPLCTFSVFIFRYGLICDQSIFPSRTTHHPTPKSQTMVQVQLLSAIGFYHHHLHYASHASLGHKNKGLGSLDWTLGIDPLPSTIWSWSRSHSPFLPLSQSSIVFTSQNLIQNIHASMHHSIPLWLIDFQMGHTRGWNSSLFQKLWEVPLGTKYSSSSLVSCKWMYIFKAWIN